VGDETNLFEASAFADLKDPFLQEAITRGSFDTRIRRLGGALGCILPNCPYINTAEVDLATACLFHLGLVHGRADQLGAVTADSGPSSP
jgi:hypothetical protein